MSWPLTLLLGGRSSNFVAWTLALEVQAGSAPGPRASGPDRGQSSCVLDFRVSTSVEADFQNDISSETVLKKLERLY